MASKNLSTKQVMAGFGVSDMTVWTWRQGTATKEKIPFKVEGRNVIFDEGAVAKWGKQYGLKWDAAAAAKVIGGNVGPKAKPVATKKTAPVKKTSAKVVPLNTAKKKKAVQAAAA